MDRRWIQAAGILTLGIFLSACGGGRPEWVRKGSGAFKHDQKMIYGVGIAENISSEALRRTTADNRAISEISRQLSTISTSLMRDYMSSTGVTAEAKEQGEQYVENTVKTFTSNVVSGVKITDRYQDKSGTLYSLASLNIDDLKNLANEVKGLSASVRDYIKANAEQAFDKMAEEEDRHAQ